MESNEMNAILASRQHQAGVTLRFFSAPGGTRVQEYYLYLLALKADIILYVDKYLPLQSLLFFVVKHSKVM